ncbi:VCBS domain-containing protein, partial [Aurantimonas sp. 22II-16-19i]|uniref:beta strand repeat-containing protein n=1 Tax=Aurantimonas sp. 22II-16-19i TaxID=1317114 RepID=UPI0009F7F531
MAYNVDLDTNGANNGNATGSYQEGSFLPLADATVATPNDSFYNQLIEILIDDPRDGDDLGFSASRTVQLSNGTSALVTFNSDSSLISVQLSTDTQPGAAAVLSDVGSQLLIGFNYPAASSDLRVEAIMRAITFTTGDDPTGNLAGDGDTGRTISYYGPGSSSEDDAPTATLPLTVAPLNDAIEFGAVTFTTGGGTTDADATSPNVDTVTFDCDTGSGTATDAFAEDGSSDSSTLIVDQSGTLSFSDPDFYRANGAAGDIDPAGDFAIAVSAMDGSSQAFALPDQQAFLDALVLSNATIGEDGNGEVTYAVTLPQSAVDFVPTGETYTFTYTITLTDRVDPASGNATSSDTVTLTFTVTGANDAPVAADDAVGSALEPATDEDTTFSFDASTLLANDTDVDVGDTADLAVVGLAASAGADPQTETVLTVTSAEGATVTFDTGTGQITYQPGSGFQDLAVGESRADSFSYVIEDASGARSIATVTLTVGGANDAPTITSTLLSDGIVTTDLGGTSDVGFDLAMRPAGFVVAGVTGDTAGAYEVALVGYLADGQVDTSFGENGVATVDLDASLGATRPAGAPVRVSVVADGAGGFVVSADYYNGADHDFALVRFDANGELDTDFGPDGTGGIVTTPILAADNYAQNVTIDGSGNILVVGSTFNGSNYDLAIVRYTSDGELDTSFSGDGIATLNVVSSGIDFAHDIVATPAGILVSGTASGNFFVARYTSAGVLDLTFGGGDGIVTTSFNGAGSAYGMTVTSTGEILVSGFAALGGGGTDFVLVQYTAGGVIDTTFGTNGIVTTPLAGTSEFSFSVTTLGDGDIIVAGAQGSNFALVRYNSDGTLDTSFGNGGIVVTDLGAADAAYSVTVTTDGKLLVAGGSGGDFAVVRYNADGSLDTSFDSDNLRLSDEADLAETDAPLTASGSFAVADVDTSDEVTGAVTSVSAASETVAIVTDGNDLVSVNGVSAADLQAMLTVSQGIVVDASSNSGTLAWAFDSANATGASASERAFDFLSAGDELTLTYDVTVADGNGGTATETVTITITGTNDGPVATADSNSGDAVVEAGVDAGNAAVAGDASATGNVLDNDDDVDANDTLVVTEVTTAANGGASGVVTAGTGSTDGTTITGLYGTLTIGADG